MRDRCVPHGVRGSFEDYGEGGAEVLRQANEREHMCPSVSRIEIRASRIENRLLSLFLHSPSFTLPLLGEAGLI